MATQDANWDTIREQRNVVADAMEDHWPALIDHVSLVGNTVVIDHADGSQVTWTPTITKNADR